MLIQTIVSIINAGVNILNAMFPTLFKKVGEFLLKLNIYVWIIIVLLLIIVGQEVFILNFSKG